MLVVPFKSKEGKSRLASVLDGDSRRGLAEAMLRDVLEAIGAAGLLPRCYVVSSDSAGFAIAKSLGASVIPEPSDTGVNAAVERCLEALSGSEDFMVLPSDLPLLKPLELRRALSLGERFSCVVSPSRAMDGTNLLLFSRHSNFSLSYDSDSFWNHVCEAARKEISLAVYCGKGVLFDVDSVDDLRDLSVAPASVFAAKFARKVVKKRASC